jgi:cell division protein FtsW
MLGAQEMKKQPVDIVLLLSVIGLISIGIIMIFSTSPTIGLMSYKDSYYFIKRHMVFTVLGIIAMGVAIKLPTKFYKKWALHGYILSVILMAMTMIPGLGVSIAGARRWLNLGIQFQPTEILKFWIIVYAGVFFSNKKIGQLKKFKSGFLPAILILAIPVFFLAQQPDLGNTVLIGGIFILLMYINMIPHKQIITLVGGGIGMAVLSILANPYQLKRVKTFLSPWDDPLGISYHIIQSFIAIGSGGIFGQGLGESKLKYAYLPLHYADFIFSIVCEEGGLIFASLTIFLFWLMFKRGMEIAKRQTDMYLQTLAAGLTLTLVLQGIINIGCVIGLLPVTGIPLTFISFGGTAFVVSMFYVGVILNISQNTSYLHPKPEAEAPLTHPLHRGIHG